MKLTTERLILREFEEQDWSAVHAYQVNPLHMRYYPWTDRTPADAQEFVREQIARQHEVPRTKRQLAVALKSTGQLIGSCGIRMNAPSATEADMGYELAPEQWGNGFATEAARAIAEFGFTELGLHRIWAWCVADNIGSAHVLQKIGMRLEGRLRDKEFYRDRWWDRLLYAMLEGEWRARRDNRGFASSV